MLLRVRHNLVAKSLVGFACRPHGPALAPAVFDALDPSFPQTSSTPRYPRALTILSVAGIAVGTASACGTTDVAYDAEASSIFDFPDADDAESSLDSDAGTSPDTAVADAAESDVAQE